MLRLEHVGIAVSDADAAADAFRALFGREPYAREVVEAERVRTVFVEAGSTKLEFIDTTDTDSAIGRHLQRRGPGLHHLAFEVEDLDAAHARLEEAGFRLLGSPRAGADRKRIFFVHPKSAAGILVECCAVDADRPVALRGAGPEGGPACLVVGSDEHAEVARALARRCRVWFTPRDSGRDHLPDTHHVVVIGARSVPTLPSGCRLVLIDPSPDTDPAVGPNVLIVDTLGQGHRKATVRLPVDLLTQLPDPAATLGDVVAAFLGA